MKRSHVRARSARRGGSMLEFVLVFPVVLLTILGVIEFALLLFVMNLTDFAAREGARRAAVSYTRGDNTAVTAEIENHVISFFAGHTGLVRDLDVRLVAVNPSTGVATGSWDTAEQGELVAAQITGTYRPIFTWVLPSGGVAIDVQASMFSEGN